MCVCVYSTIRYLPLTDTRVGVEMVRKISEGIYTDCDCMIPRVKYTLLPYKIYDVQ